MPHLIETVRGLADRGIGFRSLQEAIDTTTPGGRLVFHIFGSLAEFERDLIRERTMAGLAAARRRGRVGGRPTVMTAGAKAGQDEQAHDHGRQCRKEGRPPLLTDDEMLVEDVALGGHDQQHGVGNHHAEEHCHTRPEHRPPRLGRRVERDHRQYGHHHDRNHLGGSRGVRRREPYDVGVRIEAHTVESRDQAIADRDGRGMPRTRSRPRWLGARTSTRLGRVCRPNSYAPTKVCRMAQPHKGDRDQVAARLAHPVYVAVKSAAAQRGMPISQYVADVLAAHVGRPDLVRQLDQEVLPQSA